MVRGGDINLGTCLLINNVPHIVVDREFVSPGKGSAFARVKAKSLKTGNIIMQTIKTADSVEDAQVDLVDCQYQYSDGENFMFMNNETFDQFGVSMEVQSEKKPYLKEGETYTLIMFNGEAIDIKIPYKMIFTVTESENYVKGDTVSGATKPITTETGLVVRVPLFIKQGERILVNTESNDYVERVNN
ncbi:MAG: elongation factor P [Rectinemataceae bacterium]|nr:elongation factor P [Rectinemataceae bacterium]